MDVRQRATGIRATPASAFAVGALVVDLLAAVVPVLDGSSYLSFSVADGFPFRVKVANLLMLFAGAVAILVGLGFLRRGRAVVASGVFVGLLVVLGLRWVSSVLLSIEGWGWGTTIVLGLQAIECVLLFLAARAALRHP
ncbi:MAG TPA: hypothetical protein VIC58_04960 [Actinomycetota bacterium]